MDHVDSHSVRVLSLFAGVDGLGIGVRMAIPDARTVCYVEREFAACEVLAARMADGSIEAAPIFTDIAAFDGSQWRGAVDFIEGGFPCTDLSVAGKREGIGGKRSGLWHEYVRLIDEIQPAFAFIENVDGLISSLTLLHRGEIMEHFERLRGAAEVASANGDYRTSWHIGQHVERLHRRLLPTHGMSALLYVQLCLEQMGYRSEAGLFTAGEVGASHARNRCFILAYKPGGRLRILREPSGSDGLADGSSAELGHAEGDDQRRDTVPGQHRERISSGGSSGHVADATRDDGNGPHRETGARWGVREAGDTVDDTGDTEWWPISERGGSGSEGIDAEGEAHGGAKEPGEILADSDECAGERSQSRQREWSILAPDGSGDEYVADSEHAERRTEHQEHADAHRGDGSGRGGDHVGDADKPGLEGRGERGCGLRDERPSWTAGIAGLPVFAPGPDYPGWPDILRRFPWLAPALTKFDAQSYLQHVDDGMADMVVRERTDALRAVGNGVVSLCAAYALVVLARRAGIADACS